MELLSIVDPGTWTRIGVHFGLFFGALRGGATPAQLSHWVGKGALSLNGVTGTGQDLNKRLLCNDGTRAWV
jgi:acyl-CoA oxidase